MDAAHVDTLDGAQYVVVAAEKDRCVSRVKRQQSRVGRPLRVPFEASLGVERDAGQFASQPFQSFGSIFNQVDVLDVGRDHRSFARWRFNQGKNRFAEGARLREFSKAPF